MKLSLVSCVILSLLFCGCIKDDDMCGEPEPSGVLSELDSLGLPPATTTGENTMGCLINGEPWMPLKTNFLGGLNYHIPFSYSASGSPNGDGYFSFQGHQDYDTLTSFLSLSASNVLNIGGFSEENYGIGGSFLDSSESNDFPGYSYDLDSTYSENLIEITRLDNNEGIISGLFNFRVEDQGDTILITNGRFDLKGE